MRAWCWIWMVLWLLPGCAGDDDDTGSAGGDDDTTAGDDDSGTADDDDTADDLIQGIALREDGWLRGDLHIHTQHSDGFDTVATTIALAEYYTHETFVAAHPEFEGNGLDYLAITDHNTVACLDDPEFVSDQLILVVGEEWSTSGHANRFGVTAHVSNGASTESAQAAADAAHAEGGAMSPNHPMFDGHLWGWDLRDHDTVEVWNMGWALGSPESTPETLAAWEASRGDASPFARRAAHELGVTASGQARIMVEAMLARGAHVGFVGGSDRHALVLPATPTTYVHAVAQDATGVVDAIRARHTFVSRNPAAAQVLLEVVVDGEVYQAGDAIPVPPAGAQVTVTARVGRARDGELRLVLGHAVDTDEEIETAVLGETVLQLPVDSADFVGEHTLEVLPGDWLYPFVLEPLVPSWATAEQAELIEEMAATCATAGGDVLELAVTLAPVLDVELLGDPSSCDPEEWQPDRLQCVDIIEEGMGSFYIPDLLDRAANAYVQDGATTDWCMGAIASAVMFVEG